MRVEGRIPQEQVVEHRAEVLAIPRAIPEQNGLPHGVEAETLVMDTAIQHKLVLGALKLTLFQTRLVPGNGRPDQAAFDAVARQQRLLKGPHTCGQRTA